MTEYGEMRELPRSFYLFRPVGDVPGLDPLEIFAMLSDHDNKTCFRKFTSDFRQVHFVELRKEHCQEVSAKDRSLRVLEEWKQVCHVAAEAYKKLNMESLDDEVCGEVGESVSHDELVKFGGPVQLAVDNFFMAHVSKQTEREGERKTLSSSRGVYISTAASMLPPAHVASPSSGDRSLYMAHAAESKSKGRKRRLASAELSEAHGGGIISCEDVLSLSVLHLLGGQQKRNVSFWRFTPRDPRLSSAVQVVAPGTFDAALAMSKSAFMSAAHEADEKMTLQQGKGRRGRQREVNFKASAESDSVLVTKSDLRPEGVPLGDDVTLGDVQKLRTAALQTIDTVGESHFSDYVTAAMGWVDILPSMETYTELSGPRVSGSREDGFFAEMALAAPTRTRMRRAALLAASQKHERDIQTACHRGAVPSELKPVRRLRVRHVEHEGNLEPELEGVFNAVHPSQASLALRDDGGRGRPAHTQTEVPISRENLAFLGRTAAELSQDDLAGSDHAMSGAMRKSGAQAIWIALEEIAKARMREIKGSGSALPEASLTRDTLRREIFEQTRNAGFISYPQLRDEAAVLVEGKLKVADGRTVGTLKSKDKVDKLIFQRFLKFHTMDHNNDLQE